MEEKSKKDFSKKGGIILIVVICILIITMAIIIVDVLKDKKKTSESQEGETEQKVITGTASKSTSNGTALSEIDSSSTSKEKRKMEDYVIIGELEIPKTDLKCNILDEVTKRSIEIAVATIYTTGGLNQPGNTVIYGHNYRNSLFFSKNDELEVGDKFYIKDEDGNKLTYTIYNKFETTSTDTSFYARDAEMTGGKIEATLSTCTDDASTTDRRLIIQGVVEE